MVNHGRIPKNAGFRRRATFAPPRPSTTLQPTSQRTAELDRLGDEIAELSVHLEAATARLLALVREFDARGGWNTGFRSCAAWLAWRVGLAPGAARERVRVARAHELDPGAPGERYQVVVHVDAAVLADPEQPGQSVLEEGSHVPAGTSRRLAGDARAGW
jgi:hypothetical protein